MTQAYPKKGIKRAKLTYKKRVEDHFSENDPRRVWQGFHQITNYKGSSITPTNKNGSLAGELNCFFARFEQKTSGLNPVMELNPGSHVPFLQEHEVRHTQNSESRQSC